MASDASGIHQINMKITYLLLVALPVILILGLHMPHLGRGIRDGFITLTVEFLNFFVAKCLEIRLILSTWEPVSSIPSLLFWVAFAFMNLIHLLFIVLLNIRL
ncbi:hypothetical protein OWV82_024713 [Melia azedarach]|uniref:Uncharacterized protein n=1 Tax=Melia azedarach TaxID=155640 RepID=A0ACC1WQP6_MELAZ|nr:hypothetical protein OWV82_024713 [Melia azedarach]